MKRRSGIAIAFWLGTSSLASAMLPSQALAQEARSYQIPAGPLAAALNRLAEESGIRLVYAADMAAGRATPGLQGSFAPAEALSRLLAGTGLTFRQTDTNAFTLEPAPQTSGAVQLGPVRVAGSGVASHKAVNERLTTEGTRSYTARATAAATRLPLTLRETPQSVTVMTNQEIKDRGLDTLDEALKNVTGMSVQPWEAYRSYIYSRGFEVTNYQRDGIPTVSDSAMGLENTVLYDRIEVVRGATGLLTGSGQPSASLNLVRKRATSDVPTAEFSALAGSWRHFRGTADVSTPLNESGSIRARIVGAVRTRHLYTDFYKDDTQAVLGTVDIDLGADTTLTLAADYQHQMVRGAPFGGLPLLYSDGSYTNWNPSNTTAPRWATNEFSQYSLSASIAHSFGESWSLKGNYIYTNREGAQSLLYLGGFPDKTTGTGMSPFAGRYFFPTKQHSVDLHVDGGITAFGRRHELVFGAMHSDADQDAYSSSATSDLPPVGNFFEWDGSFPEPNWTPLGRYRDDKTRQSAVYGAVRLSLADPVKIIAGARYSKWKADNSGVSRMHEKLTPYVGAIVDITKQISAYASYTSIFEPQSRRDCNGEYLDPVVGKNYEVGIKGEHFDGRLNTSFSVFRVEQDNVGERDGNELVPGTSEFAYVGVKGVKTKGFEAEISGEIADGWQLSAGFSRAASRQPDGTPFRIEAPRNQMNVFTSYRFGGRLDGLTLGAGGRWQSKAHKDIETSTGTIRYTQGDYAIVDLMAKYELDNGMSIQINADNIFNKKYYQFIQTFGYTRNVTARLTMDF